MGDHVIVVGSGAREHALVWKLAQSPLIETIATMPGNPGTAQFGDNIPVEVLDVDAIVRAAQARRADLVVVGPEAPLAAGLADALRAAGIAVFGPNRNAARIESSKAWAKDLMVSAGVLTARAVVLSPGDDIHAALTRFEMPVVVKADGLAAGKGVVVTSSAYEAETVIRDMFSGALLGSPAEQLLIEEFLSGQEVSLLVLTDGTSLMPLLPACDYKRAYDDDGGPNTGGMGGYAPPPVVDQEMLDTIERHILRPVVEAMSAAGSPMQGVLYAGLIITAGGPKVIEFNCRFGDPETQIVLPLLESDLYPLLRAAATGALHNESAPKWFSGSSVGVVMASGGYPGTYRTGVPISDSGPSESTCVFFAGVTNGSEGELLTSGGRVLTCVGTGETIAIARDRAYARVDQIAFAGAEFRTDIARRELNA